MISASVCSKLTPVYSIILQLYCTVLQQYCTVLYCTLFRIILQQKFLPASHEDLLAAFRTLDTENTGHLARDQVTNHSPVCSSLTNQRRASSPDQWQLTQLFTEEGEAFSQEEMTEFCSAALDPLTKSVHYKEYVHFLGIDDNF